MKIKFFLIDVSYEVKRKEPTVLLWGVSEASEPILVMDRGFRPYFYVLPEESVRPEDLLVRLRALSRPASPIIEAEVLEMKYYGRPVKVVKVSTLIPEYVRTYRDEARKLPGVADVLEADIRYYMRYLIDKDISPSSWVEAEVEEVENTGRYRVKKVFEVTGEIRNAPLEPPPDLRILAFDIEV
ncbi:MAG: hypothetical protein J7L55_03820 [Desulfurococcales archaeon]|nr:hypothetical protein [Desulfurococcales archaeon]